MAFHNIQCPHCFTDYTISDERYKATEGVMRCGTCREQFKAILITENETPKFDPREVFIEPLSEPLPASEGGDIELSKESELSYVSYEKQADPELENDVELMSTHEFEYSGPKEPEVPDEVLEKYGNVNELSTSQILKNLRQKAREDSFSEDTSDTISSSISDDSVNLFERGKQAQLDLELPIDDRRSQSVTARKEPELNDDSQLISEVDQLVNEKLGAGSAAIALKADRTNAKRANQNTATDKSISPVSSAPSLKTKESKAKANTTKNVSTNDFLLEPKKTKRKKRGFIGFIKFVFFFLIAIGLITILTYQLWLRQIIQLPTDQPWFTSLQSKAQPYYELAETSLSEFGVALPKRRNLGKMELLSATTEPHPTRTTTVLLKVSLINRAAIAQALPWLEMTLTDADGRLVARRNLSPTDYIYNNETSSNIGANELKKITVELLSFPKSATGYELKLLNK